MDSHAVVNAESGQWVFSGDEEACECQAHLLRCQFHTDRYQVRSR